MLEIAHSDLVLDFGLLGGHHQHRLTASNLLDPVALAKYPQSLSYGLKDALRRDLDRVFNPFEVANGDLACPNRHRELHIIFVFCSLYDSNKGPSSLRHLMPGQTRLIRLYKKLITIPPFCFHL